MILSQTHAWIFTKPTTMFNQSLKSGSWFLILVVVNFRSKIYRIRLLSKHFSPEVFFPKIGFL